MSTPKSYAGYALSVFSALLKDCAATYPGLRRELNRDLIRLGSAIESHGIRFVTETMPSYRKHLDQCLDKKCLTSTRLTHFGVRKRTSVIPSFFQGLTRRIFDDSGELKPDFDKDAVRWLRQLLGVFRKFRLDCGPERKLIALKDFVEVDGECFIPSHNWNEGVAPSSTLADASQDFRDAIAFADLPQGIAPPMLYGLLASIQKAADYITCSLGFFDPSEWRFHHGPGAVSDAKFGSYKYDFPTWSDRLDSVFSYADFALANYGQLRDAVACRGTHSDSSECGAKIACVLKTTKTPRLIALEPTSSQWAQQSVRDYFYKQVAHSPISRFIDFTRQDLNACAALEASSQSDAWTIDLSSASDRVSCWHIERMFRKNAGLLNALWASRSQFIRQDISSAIPEVIYLKKYSTMGNATTFPVQSLFFLAVIIGCAAHLRRVPVGYVVRNQDCRKVRVFGDDLVVPSDIASVVVEVLEILGLRVNRDKTFGGFAFRESCGVDAFLGQDVSSVSILDFQERTRPGSIASCVAVHNNLLVAGYVETAQYLRTTVEALGLRNIRELPVGSGQFGWYSFLPSSSPFIKRRWDGDLQVAVERVLVQESVNTRVQPTNASALLQFFTEASDVVSSAYSTIGHLARRAQVKLRLRWVEVVK